VGGEKKAKEEPPLLMRFCKSEGVRTSFSMGGCAFRTSVRIPIRDDKVESEMTNVFLQNGLSASFWSFTVTCQTARMLRSMHTYVLAVRALYAGWPHDHTI
jgi:hypothetical protein